MSILGYVKRLLGGPTRPSRTRSASGHRLIARRADLPAGAALVAGELLIQARPGGGLMIGTAEAVVTLIPMGIWDAGDARSWSASYYGQVPARILGAEPANHLTIDEPPVAPAARAPSRRTSGSPLPRVGKPPTPHGVVRTGPGGDYARDWPCSAKATQGKPGQEAADGTA